MESGIPVVSTTSSTDLLDDRKNKNQPNENERRAENADSITQNNEDSTKNETKEANINNSEHLIEGLAKPSSALEKVDFHRVLIQIKESIMKLFSRIRIIALNYMCFVTNGIGMTSNHFCNYV